MHKILILWDIDGTLLHSTGAGMKALAVALQAEFGIQDNLAGIDYAGRTDRHIVRQILDRHGIAHTQAAVSRFIEGYARALPASLSSNGSRVLPGAAAIVERAAAHPAAAQGLLTGNMRRGAEIKLGHHGLWGYFPVGAFADDSETRNDLGPHALSRARAHWGDPFDPGHVWVVGDTPHDIACARAFGARVLAVCTGHFDRGALAGFAPDVLLEDLSDGAAFWAALGLAP